MTQAAVLAQLGNTPLGMRNKIINGSMIIDQRNSGAAVTATGAYPVDRFIIHNTSNGSFSAQQSTTAPAGFSKSVSITITASDSSLTGTERLVFRQHIEGYNIADLNWGTSNAKTVTLSFKVRSSVTGTFSGSLRNSAGNRSYPFTYSISSADTWTDISVTIPGETNGSWNITNGEGVIVFFSLGVGPDLQGTAGAWASGNYWGASGETQLVNTNGATFYITGVQLEVGSTATEFEHRPYGNELMLCYRYYYQIDCSATPAGYFPGRFVGIAETGSNVIFTMHWPSGEMRSTPTAVQIGAMRLDDIYSTNNPAGAFNSANLSKFGGVLQVAVASGTFVQGRAIRFVANSTSGLGFSAEIV